MAADTANLEARGSIETQDSVPPQPESGAGAQESSSRDILRPLLTIAQAAAVLGKSIRSVERSLAGRWGNKLPEGWSARKVPTENGDEWRIVPPPGFRVRQHDQEQRQSSFGSNQADTNANTSLEYVTPRNATPWRQEYHNLDQPTIVIDRSEEVEHLLRELLSVQKSLSEERRLRMEDLRITSQLHSSMKLLEVSNSENNQAKSELESTKKAFEELKNKYEQLARLPWWKRVFRPGVL